MFNGKRRIQFTIKHLAPDWAVIRAMIDIAWPATLQFLIGSGSWIVLASLVVTTGHSDASAGYQIAIRIVMFFMLPAWGMSNAAATLVGQNLGALQPQRAEDSVIKTAQYNAVLMALVSIILLRFTPSIISLFTWEAAVAYYAIVAVRIISTGYIFYGIGMVMANSFNGAGDTLSPTIINLFGFWFFQIPLAWLLSITFAMGSTGVFIAILAAETAISIIACTLFKKGKWKLKKV